MTHKFLHMSRFAIPALAAIAASALWITFSDNVASGRPGSGDSKTTGLAAAILSARHADADSDTARAVEYYDAALAIDPNNPNLLEQSYFLAVQSGNFDSAVPSAKKAYELMPERGLARIVLAAHHFKRKEYQRAWSYIDEIPGQGLNAFALPMIRAWGSAPHRTAEESLSELAAMESYRDIEDVAQAMSAMLNEYYGRNQTALERYDALAFGIENRRPSMLRIVVGGYHRLGQSDKAVELVERYQGVHGPSPTIESFANPKSFSRKMSVNEGMAEAFYSGAEMLMGSRSRDRLTQFSIAYAQFALHLNPDMNVARRFIGYALALREHYEESNDILKTVKKSAPGYLETRMQIAENYMRMGRTDEALSTLETTIRNHGQWPELHVATGDVLRQLQRYAEAVEAYDRALELYPDNRDENWAAYYMRGIALERAKNWDRAEQDFRRALELNPEDPGIMNYLGYSYLDRGENLAEARRLIEKAYEKSPNDGYITDSLGWAMYVMGEFEDAVVYLERAVELAPADATINEHLGDAYWQVGRKNEARFQWERALTLDPEDAQEKAILSKLERGLARN